MIIRGVHSPKITTGTITWKALNDNTIPEWLGWPNKGTTNLPYISGQRKLNFSSATKSVDLGKNDNTTTRDARWQMKFLTKPEIRRRRKHQYKNM